MPPRPVVAMASPLLGYNNNVRHRGHVFHIQTEDSGIKYPHVITHLFADGGRILKTLKTSYAEHLESDRLAEIVRTLMKQQHKAMFVALRDGRFDELAGMPPVEAAGESQAPVSESMPDSASSAPPSRMPQRAQAPDLFTSFPPEAPLDIETLERVAMSTHPGSAAESPSEVVTPPKPEKEERKPSGRYAQTRPASIFSANSPAASIFGGELVSEQSLDEVILGYLAEDLGETDVS